MNETPSEALDRIGNGSPLSRQLTELLIHARRFLRCHRPDVDEDLWFHATMPSVAEVDKAVASYQASGSAKGMADLLEAHLVASNFMDEFSSAMDLPAVYMPAIVGALMQEGKRVAADGSCHAAS